MTHPTEVTVTYSSGRTENLTCRTDWLETKNSLLDAIRHGAVREFSYKQKHSVKTTIKEAR